MATAETIAKVEAAHDGLIRDIEELEHKRKPAPTPPAKPKRKRSRIKGADTTPDVDGLPS